MRARKEKHHAATAVARGAPATLHGRFTEVAATAPARVAVRDATGSITYGELDRRSDRLAASLGGNGVARGEIVALAAGRDADTIVGIVGILKAGCAYLPIDPSTPDARIRMLVADSSSRVAVTNDNQRSRFADLGMDVHTPVHAPGTADRVVGSAIAGEMDGGDLAYIIYTSGSTGTPKGVLIDHGNVLRLFDHTARWCDVGADDVWTQFHSVAFDYSVWEIWGALLHGGRVVVVPFETSRSPAEFHRLVASEGVTVLSQTPSAFRLYDRADQRSPRGHALRYIVFGGERLDPAVVEPWVRRHGATRPQLINMYGLTEGTVHVSAHRVTPDDLEHADVSNIGTPLADLDFTVHDASGGVVEPGQVGELWVRGRGVSRGYLNRPVQTAAAFGVADHASDRLYRTGDLVRTDGAGEYHYLGRIDDQIQIRGFRVEPAEIETVLLAHPEVSAAAVTTRDHGAGDVRIVAHIVPADPALGGDDAERVESEIRTRVAALPHYMHPSAYTITGEMPMTNNGKLNRGALRDELDTTSARRSREYEEIATAIEAVWRNILGGEVTSRRAQFFDLGGTSLALIRMFDSVNEQYGTDLDISILAAEGATVDVLARNVQAAQGDSAHHAV